MDKQEALILLETKLGEYRRQSYAELRARIGQEEHLDIVGTSGVQYQVEVQVFWDHKPEGQIRVLGSVDDSGWRAWLPLCRDFLVAPEGPAC